MSTGLALASLPPSISSEQASESSVAAASPFVRSAVVGIVAGVGPANQAAPLQRASALRHE